MRTDSEGPHGSPLGVDLIDVRHSLGQCVWCDLVPILVSEFGGFLLRPNHLGFCIRCRSLRVSVGRWDECGWGGRTHQTGHDASDAGSETKHMGDRVGVDEFVGHLLLGDAYGGVLASNGHRGVSTTRNGFEGVF